MTGKILNGKLLIFAAFMLAGIVFAGTAGAATPTVPDSVWAWGQNNWGQLGIGDFSDWNPHPTPLQVIGISDVTAISAGRWWHRLTVALKSDGTVWAWGQNNWGQLGTGVYDSNPHPTPIQVVGISNVTAIAAGEAFTLALKSDGTVWAWGSNRFGKLGIGAPDNVSCCWYPDPYPPAQVIGISNVTAISAGRNHAIALKSDGTVWTWGQNSAGSLGIGVSDYDPHPTPAQVIGISNVTAIAGGAQAGDWHGYTIALKSDGTLWAWGANYYGQLGTGIYDRDPHPSPAQVIGISNVTAIDAGDSLTTALKSDGTVWTWGANYFGQLGIGVFDGDPHPTPAQVIGLSNVTAISAGRWHAIAIRSDGTLWTWGRNYYGELGDNTTTDRYFPVEVVGQSGVGNLKNVVAFAGGEQYTIAIIAPHIYSGILPPIRTDGSSIFKLGSTVPVKFRITDANGNYVSTATATLTYQLITNEVLGTVEEPISSGAANEGNTFRYDSTDNLYIFNLATEGMNRGTYQLNINLDDGTVHTVRISLR